MLLTTLRVDSVLKSLADNFCDITLPSQLREHCTTAAHNVSDCRSIAACTDDVFVTDFVANATNWYATMQSTVSSVVTQAIDNAPCMTATRDAVRQLNVVPKLENCLRFRTDIDPQPVITQMISDPLLLTLHDGQPTIAKRWKAGHDIATAANIDPDALLASRATHVLYLRSEAAK